MDSYIQCPSCGKQCHVGPQHAGKRVACPSCKSQFAVPPPPPSVPATSAQSNSLHDLEAFLKKKIPNHRAIESGVSRVAKRLSSVQIVSWSLIAVMHLLLLLLSVGGVVMAMFDPDLDNDSSIVGVPLLQFLFAMYLLPTHVALFRNHKSSATIFVINLLLGWVCIGYVIALAWCLHGIGTTLNGHDAANEPLDTNGSVTGL